MHEATLSEAQRHLSERVCDMGREGELVLTGADGPVATVLSVSHLPSSRALKPQPEGAIVRPVPTEEDDSLDEMLEGRL